MDRAVVITSGGLDSTVLCHYADQLFDELYLMSFHYGQRHKKELEFAVKTAGRLGAMYELIELPITSLLSGSALTDDVDVPEGHYAEENMKLTVVPNRNMIMLSIAVARAVSWGATTVLAGMHAGDHPVYPDCRPEFIEDMNSAARSGNQGFVDDSFVIVAPFIGMSKAAIVTVGKKLDVPFEETWSCYMGRDKHCGRCGTCVERAEAFAEAGVPDPTEYEDPDYWKQVTKGR